MKSGVYIILNISNNNFYIGSSQISINRRIQHHFWQLRNNRHENSHLQRAWYKYGEENFVGLELENCSKENCIKREQYYIDAWKPSYNILKIADSQIGQKRTKETRDKISKALTGIKRTPEQRLRLSLAKMGCKGNIGFKHSKKTKEKLSKALKGRKCTKIHKLRVSLSKMGHKHSEETKRKMSQTHKKRPTFTKKHRKNLSLSRIGFKQSQETINKRVTKIKITLEKKRLLLKENNGNLWKQDGEKNGKISRYKTYKRKRRNIKSIRKISKKIR